MSDAGAIAESFYSAFAARDPAAMGAFYGDDAQFSDPVFPALSAGEVRAMWTLLLTSGSDLSVEHQLLSSTETHAVTQWTARYHFSATGLPVVNIVTATMNVADGLIRRHRDYFSFYRWSSQALGLPGKLLGWSPIIRRKVRGQAAARLKAYMAKQA
jgi:ketosteroid isomerase-like protein